MAIEALGYVIVETIKADEWEKFLCKVVGASSEAAQDGKSRHYQIDDRPFRFRVTGGEQDRFVAAGYRLDSQKSLDGLASRLTAAGHVIGGGDAQGAEARGVETYFSVSDPAGNGLEFYCGDRIADSAFSSPVGVKRFVTGDLGMGHAVFAAPDFPASHAFYTEMIGFHDTDVAEFRLSPNPQDPGVRFAFMHADNGRHHSLAIGEMPASPAGCVHLMLEYPTLDDVKACFARMEKEGVPESASLGQHTNDKMTSFYMRTPSGFDMEIGSDGLVIDPANWKVTSCDRPSEWGHEWAWQKAMAAQQEGQ